jgi:hypothetical protein
VTQQDFGLRRSAFNRSVWTKLSWFLLAPALFLATLDLVSRYFGPPGSTQFHIAVVVYGLAYLIPITITFIRAAKNASHAAKLVCPHCGMPLYSDVKYVMKTHKCRRCAGTVIEAV